MHAVLVEANRIRNLHRHIPNLYVDSERLEQSEKLRMEIGHRARLEANAFRFAAGRGDVERVIDEVELNFKDALAVRNRRRRQAPGTDVERDLPPMIDARGQRQADLAHDLGPHVQRRVRIRPGG